MIVDDTEELRQYPSPVGQQHRALPVVEVRVPEGADVRDLVAALLEAIAPILGGDGAGAMATGATPYAHHALGEQVAAQRRVRWQRAERGLRAHDRTEVVVVELDGPAAVRGVLRGHARGERLADGGLVAAVASHLAGERRERVPSLLARGVVPPLDGGAPEADPVARDGVRPWLGAQRGEALMQGARRRG